MTRAATPEAAATPTPTRNRILPSRRRRRCCCRLRPRGLRGRGRHLPRGSRSRTPSATPRQTSSCLRPVRRRASTTTGPACSSWRRSTQPSECSSSDWRPRRASTPACAWTTDSGPTTGCTLRRALPWAAQVSSPSWWRCHPACLTRPPFSRTRRPLVAAVRRGVLRFLRSPRLWGHVLRHRAPRRRPLRRPRRWRA